MADDTFTLHTRFQVPHDWFTRGQEQVMQMHGMMMSAVPAWWSVDDNVAFDPHGIIFRLRGAFDLPEDAPASEREAMRQDAEDELREALSSLPGRVGTVEFDEDEMTWLAERQTGEQ